MNDPGQQAPLPPGVRPYDWALAQIGVAQAHQVSRGSANIVVAVIDLGYDHHPELGGHLWRNPQPTRGDLHGWDFVDNDASLENSRLEAQEDGYLRSHHVFVAGEVAAVAPQCPIMIVRVGFGAPKSWAQGIHYAVEHGARVLIIPHSYLSGEAERGTSLFDLGADFSYPHDNRAVRDSLQYASEQGCLIVRGAADNRGRRVLAAMSALDGVMAVGSTNRLDQAADICDCCDYVEVGAPGGQRHCENAAEWIWGYSAGGRYTHFTGGCMAAGFAGGVAALVWSRHPQLSPDQLRQMLRNTARAARGATFDADGWESKLGYGILDAAAAVSLVEGDFCRKITLAEPKVELRQNTDGAELLIRLTNHGIYDANRAAVVVYNGDPKQPVHQKKEQGEILQVKQIGHSITPVRGHWTKTVDIQLTECPQDSVWVEVFCLDRHDSGSSDCSRCAVEKV